MSTTSEPTPPALLQALRVHRQFQPSTAVFLSDRVVFVLIDRGKEFQFYRMYSDKCRCEKNDSSKCLAAVCG